MSIETWNQRFREDPNAAGEAPSPFVVEQLSDFKPSPGSKEPARALDLACGAGRNALWLAEQGWDVTAVDGSDAAIEILHRRAAQRGLSIKTVVADLEAGEFPLQPAAWDLILIYAYLQRDLLTQFHDALRPGGIAAVAVHLDEPGRESRFSLQPGELASYFNGWDIRYLHEGPPQGANDDARHFASIVAVRR